MNYTETFLKHKTNFDAIKEMSIDEMADFLTDVAVGANIYANKHCIRKDFKSWLESEEEF